MIQNTAPPDSYYWRERQVDLGRDNLGPNAGTLQPLTLPSIDKVKKTS